MRKLAFGLGLLAATAALSQEFRANISGEVTDPTGAAITDARVVVTSVERGTPVEATTNAAGRYLVQFLLPGRYTLTVEKSGFKKFVREEIVLNSADRLALDVRLDLGAIAETVTVTGETALLQTESATRTALIENRVVENIPTNGRNLYQLQYTLPGVVKASTYWGSMELYAFGNVNGVIIGGGRQGENETLLDGISDTRPDRGVAFVPSLNSIQEFTLQTNTYDAQFGRVGGGVTTITVKSGTNSLHGQLFEFLKNDRLNANGWESNTFGQARVPFKQSTFGFELDGPVYVPKVADGRNRLFFMISLEGLRERNPGVSPRTLPTAEQLQGDFSRLLNSSGRAVTLYDPATLVQQPNGSYTRTAFPGNRIPADRINPVAAKVASFYPKPNRTSETPDNANNYALISPSHNSYDSWLGKMDFRVSQRSNVSFRYGQTPWSNFSKIVWGTNAAEPSGEAPSTRVSRTWGADWTYTLSPYLVFNLRGGLSRYEGFSGNVYGGGFDPRQLGFPASLVSQFSALQFPRFNLGNYSELGATQITSYETHDTYSLQPNMSWTHGRHTFKYGAEFRLYHRNQLQPGSASGSYDFDKRWTQADPQRSDPLSGNEFASFLLGLPFRGFVDRNIDPAYQNKYYALFLQDDWKLTPKLTINAGLRWDYETPRVERFNRMLRGFAFDQPSPIANQVQGLTLRGGLLYAGSSGDARLAFVPDKNNFQPRIGAAWQFRSRWVLRAGYGLTYLGQDASGAATGFSRRTDLIASTDNFLTPAVNLSDPFPLKLFPTGLLQPVGSSLGLATNLGQGIGAQYLDRLLPYSHQYSLGVQRELPGNWLLDASYVGNITRKLPVGVNLNFIPAAALNSLPVTDRPAFFNAQAPNPMAGLLPGSSINGSTVPRSQLLVAYPHFTGVSISNVPIGSQRYDALQVKGTRRFASGLAMQIAYTLSKTLEQLAPLNPQDVTLANLLNTPLEKRLIDFDTPQKLAVVTTYELPFGKGKAFGSNMHPVLNGIAGGWNLNVQWMRQTGFPFNFPNAAPLAARSAKFDDGQRDALAQKAGRPQFDPLYDKWFDVSLFPTRPQAPFTLRDFPTRFPDVRSKPMDEWEISVYKEFPIKERVRWQIRADFQNAFNHPFFVELLTTDVSNSRFGQLRPRDRNEARKVVAVMKVIF
ncbi:MAG: TonB-dependent receptor [Acidobacteria bacterium]|nr:TonB-dependent receptor [Acidobacteriota bacterium]